MPAQDPVVPIVVSHPFRAERGKDGAPGVRSWLSGEKGWIGVVFDDTFCVFLTGFLVCFVDSDGVTGENIPPGGMELFFPLFNSGGGGSNSRIGRGAWARAAMATLAAAR